nr:MAG TPA_asm: hypothetical protein [Caudoviricetes sp.]DAZ06322.1 MAG TPA: hypothetical protein [Caudoviricetes sp.]
MLVEIFAPVFLTRAPLSADAGGGAFSCFRRVYHTEKAEK